MNNVNLVLLAVVFLGLGIGSVLLFQEYQKRAKLAHTPTPQPIPPPCRECDMVNCGYVGCGGVTCGCGGKGTCVNGKCVAYTLS